MQRFQKVEFLHHLLHSQINKKDIPGTEERSVEIVRELKQGGQRAHLVSAITRQGLENLLDDVIERLNSETNEVTPTHGRGNEEKQIVLKPKPIDSDKVSIVKRDKKFVVYSQPAARIAETVDPTNWEDDSVGMVTGNDLSKWVDVEIERFQTQGILV